MMMRQTDGGLFLPDKRLLVPKHHGSRYPAVIGGPAAAAGGGGAPFDGILRADFESGGDFTVYGGSPTVTLNQGATVTGGYLDVFTNSFADAQWDADSNWSFTNLATVNLLIQPKYSGTPGTNQQFFWYGRNADSRNGLWITHDSGDGGLDLWMRTASVGYVFAGVNLGTWSPSANTTYEIELDIDTSSGATRVFIDGTQFGSTQTATGALSVEAGLFIRIGESANQGFSDADFACYDFKVWDTIQHTSDY